MCFERAIAFLAESCQPTLDPYLPSEGMANAQAVSLVAGRSIHVITHNLSADVVSVGGSHHNAPITQVR
jgi:hypothetical protein